MKVFTCRGFSGHWPIGTAAVVVAASRKQARRLLSAELVRGGLPPLAADDLLVELQTEQPQTIVLCNGDY